MKFYKTILPVAVAALLGYTQADSFSSSKCSKLESASDCINAVDSEWLDGTKCVPIVKTRDSMSDSFLGLGAITCASWKEVQASNYTIDF
jgi:hypothetical protein